jgi:hypothetical protein
MRKHFGWPLALLAFAIGETQVRGQWPYFPPPYGDVGSSGFSIVYTRRGYRFSGYVSRSYGLGGLFGPFGSSFGYSNRQVIVQNVVTPIVVVSPPESDLGGVDLDVVRPPWRQGSAPARTIERGPESPPERAPEKIAPPAAPRPPGIDLSKPKPPDAPPPPPPKPAPLPPPQPGEDRRDPDDPWRLMDLGRAAFAQQEFGNAARRFRQVTEVAPNLPLGYFLLAQADFALGKHRLAVRSIEQGLRLKPEWPEVKSFRPRLDLYKGNEAEFDAHLRRLGDALRVQPLEGDLLFLYGYQLWFDGRRAEAVVYFERARAVAADPTFIDRFLKDGAWKVVSK